MTHARVKEFHGTNNLTPDGVVGPIARGVLSSLADRGDPPRGNTVNRAPIDTQTNPTDAPEIVLTHLMEGIGIALDVPGDRMFLTDFGGSIYSARLNGSEKQMFLYAQGNLTGIAYAEIPVKES